MPQRIVLTKETVKVATKWADAIEVEEIDPFNEELKFPALNVQCGDEVKRASLGDYIVKHDDGSFAVMSATEYLAHYEE